MIAALTGGWRERFGFAARFAACAALLFGIYCFPYREVGIGERWFQSYLAAYARLVGAALGVFEDHLTVSGAAIFGRTSLTIAKNCDAMEVKILLVSAIVALEGVPFVPRTVAALLALLGIVVVNVVRIVSLYYVNVMAPELFERLHLEIWPLVLVVVAALEFLLVVRVLEGRAVKAVGVLQPAA
jgi:exosortase/archaeosortase family protein